MYIEDTQRLVTEIRMLKVLLHVMHTHVVYEWIITQL
jgi:predicted transcriptional regulator